MLNATTQKLARFECAQEILGMMIALRSNWIYTERQRSAPDHALIDKWEAEVRSFVEENAQLLLSDAEGIDRTISLYAPQVRANFLVA